MGRIAIVFGAILSVLGVVLYAIAEPAERSLTALIPTAFGVVLIVLGLLASKDQLRMHVMHMAALLGVIGCVFPGYRVVRTLLASDTYNQKAVVGQAIMSVLCALFTALCVKSFIDARRRRRAAALEPK